MWTTYLIQEFRHVVHCRSECQCETGALSLADVDRRTLLVEEDPKGILCRVSLELGEGDDLGVGGHWDGEEREDVEERE